MTVEKHKCEVCGKEVEDYYAEKGWIHIDKWGLTVANGRREDGNAKIRFYTTGIVAKEKCFDFCCKLCFVKFLKIDKS